MRGAEIENGATGPALFDGRRSTGEVARQHLIARYAERMGTAPQRREIEHARHAETQPLWPVLRRMVGARKLMNRCGRSVSTLPIHDKSARLI